ncbi:MAG: heparinase II/III family protein [Anaerolineae bacterium]|nr:heparinase II/III family protein [Anaerolineae bacterium]
MAQWRPGKERPYLLCTRAGLQAARRRLADGFPPAVAALRTLRAMAAEAATVELPIFDHSWYSSVTREAWDTIYPQVSEDTTYTPNRLAGPCLAAAVLYAFERDETALASARRILSHFWKAYGFEIEHWDVGMNYAGFGTSLLAAYDLVWNALTDGERDAGERWFHAWYEAIAKNDRLWISRLPWNAYNNHYAWHKWAIGMYGLHTGAPELVEDAIQGTMGVRELLEHGLVDDGLWHESATGYNFTAGHGLVPLAWSLRQAGWPDDLFARRFSEGKGIVPLYRAALEMLFPDGTVPSVGDCYGHIIELPALHYEYLYAALGDPQFAWALSLSDRDYDGTAAVAGLLVARPLGETQAPALRPRDWPEHGYTLMATAEGDAYLSDDTAAVLVTYGYSGIHGHRDKLSYELHADGVRWVVDAEATSPGHSFSAAVQRELNRSTLAHNTVRIDRRDQNGLGSNLPLRHVQGSPNDVQIRDDGQLYGGVAQERHLTLHEHELVDVFRLESDAPHMYDYQLHLAPGCEIHTDVALAPRPPLGSKPDEAWLRDPASARLGDGQVHLTAHLGTKALRIEAQAPPESELILCSFPSSAGYTTAPIPMVILRANASHATFTVRFRWL